MTPTQRKKLVVAHSVHPGASQHVVETNRALARWLAQILGLQFAGDYDPLVHGQSELYLLPTQTIVGPAAARQLRLKGPDDLWGGYVEHDFICTKAITHGLLNRNAVAPPGWAPLFSQRVRNVVLDGLSVFSLNDARPAASHLLYSGPIRMKPIHACAGRGQQVIESLERFDEMLAQPDVARQFNQGVVLEQDLQQVATYSVGQSFIAGHVLGYCGQQYLTEDSDSEQVYGGSELLVVQGGYPELLALQLPQQVRLAVQQARVFDAAADEAYPRFSPPGATTTSPRAWTPKAGSAAAYSNNRGAWAVPAAPKWRLCRPLSIIRTCARFVCPRWKPMSTGPCRPMPSRSIAGPRNTVTFFSNM